MQKKERKTTDMLVRGIFDPVFVPTTNRRVAEFLREPVSAPEITKHAAKDRSGLWILSAGATLIIFAAIYFMVSAAETQGLLNKAEAVFRQKNGEVSTRVKSFTLNQNQAALLSQSLAELSKKRALAVQKAQFLEKNVRHKAEWTAVLSALGQVEHEGIRFTEFSMKNGRFSARGAALDQMRVLRLVDELNRSTYFKGASITAIENILTSSGNRVFSFKVSGRAIF